MNNNFSIDNAINRVLAGTIIESCEFREFCIDVNELDRLCTPVLYTEEVKHVKKNLKQKVGNIASSTKDTTKTAAETYDYATTIGGAVYKAEFNLVAASLKLILRILGWLINKALLLPELITKVIERITDLPKDITSKIRGDIQLYITADDIDTLYNRSLMTRIRNFVDYAKQLSRGETWTTFFTKEEREERPTDVSANDAKLCKMMKGEYQFIKNLNFTKTLINLGDNENVNIYFDSKHLLTFHTIDGKEQHGSYYAALTQLGQDIKNISRELSVIRELIGDKYNETRMNGSYMNLTKGKRNLIDDTIQMTSKCIVVIGNITKYIVYDMDTIYKAVDRIAKAGRVDVNSVKRMDAINYKTKRDDDDRNEIQRKVDEANAKQHKEEMDQLKRERKDRKAEYRAYRKNRNK